MLTLDKPFKNMGLMKTKAFEFDEQLAADFEEFCRMRNYVEKRIAAAAVRDFMSRSADEREEIIMRHMATESSGTANVKIAARKSTKIKSTKLNDEGKQ